MTDPEPGVMFCLDCMFKHTRDLEHHMEDAVRVDVAARDYWNAAIDDLRLMRKYILERMKGKNHQECATCHPTSNPGKRLYEPSGLTKKEAASKRAVGGRCKPHSRALYCRLTRCIKQLEPQEAAGEIESAVAVCRARVT